MPGASACIAEMTNQVEKARQAARKAADDVTEAIYDSAKNVYCPVDKGDLKESAENKVISDGDVYKKRISFGSGLSYAFWVHERPGPRHNNPATASWKYLQIPFEKMTPEFFAKIDKEVSVVLKK